MIAEIEKVVKWSMGIVSAEFERIDFEIEKRIGGETSEPPPEYPRSFRRGLVHLSEEDYVEEWVPLDEARLEMARIVREHLVSDSDEILLMRTPPGVGKTTLAVEACEGFVRGTGGRVMYAGPRHAFFSDVIEKSSDPSMWYEWQPRRAGSDGVDETCRWADEISTWMARGYDGMSFCSSPTVCGWAYINNGCPYHRQKKVAHHIIFAQHQHLALGHPLLGRMGLLVIDENPIFSSFKREWWIPASYIIPTGIDPRSRLATLLTELKGLTGSGVMHLDGRVLIDRLGGADDVLAACGEFLAPVDASPLAPVLRGPSSVANVDFFYVPHLVRLLSREARAVQEGRECISRVSVRPGLLGLFLRYDPSDLPRKIVALDATGNARMYEEVFKRDVTEYQPHVLPKGRIFQVWDRANGVSSLVTTKKRTPATDEQPEFIELDFSLAGQQLADVIEHTIARFGYKDPVLLTHKKIKDGFAHLKITRDHFYNVRGTNLYENADAIFVAGTPMPPLMQIVNDAKMIFFDRDDPFTVTWAERDVRYPGTYAAYPVSNFWGDPDLEAVVWQVREAEILQAAHRGRPINRECDVWLFTNVPVAGLPVNIVSVREAVESPPDVSPYRWVELLQFAKQMDELYGAVTTRDLIERFTITRATANRYIAMLVSVGWKSLRAASRRKPLNAASQGGYEDAFVA